MTAVQRLLDDAASCYVTGQHALSDAMKRLVSVSGSVCASHLDYSDDAPFLEPLLFSHFAGKNPLPLDQVLWGYLQPDSRPEEFVVQTDASGAVFLPRVGYVATGLRDLAVELASDATSGHFVVRRRGIPVGATCQPIRVVRGSSVELGRHTDPCLDAIFQSSDWPDPIHDAGDASAERLDKAFEILEGAAPQCYELLTSVTRRIVLFREPRLNSFATLAAHGAAFLQVDDDASEVFFVEDLAHQCGHILFNAMSVDKSSLFAVDSNSPLAALTGEPDEHRSVSVALHGAFTLCLMGGCLAACAERRVFSGLKHHELLGRLSFALKRLSLDLECLNQDGLFAGRGADVFRRLAQVFDELYGLTRDRIAHFDMRNQTYNFSFDRFLERNRA